MALLRSLFAFVLIFACLSVCFVHSFGFGRSGRHHVGSLNQLVSRSEREHLLKYGRSSRALEMQYGQDPLYFDQYLDHFNLADQRTFKMKYYLNSTFWTSPKNPVFYLLGGEGALSVTAVTGHFILNQYAQQYGALVVAIEHRFYGESIPLNSSSTDNLRYLSSQQALADYAYFHDYLNQQLSIPASVPWIVFGGSYSGNLAAWIKAKYPQLFFGSFAASSPVLAQHDFPEYFEVVANSIGPQCTQLVQTANNVVTQLLQTTDGKDKLQTLFQTCTPIGGANDVALFLEDLSEPFASVVQYNNDNTNYEPFNITGLCSLMSSSSDPLTSLYNTVKAYRDFAYGGACMEVAYADYINDLQATSAGRSWTYQTCTEFGYFQTGESSAQPFSPLISLSWFDNQCDDIFGITNFRPKIDETNRYYGALNLQANRVVLTNGNVDPWHALGIISGNPPGSESAIIFIEGTAHCADMYPPRASDVIGLIEARQTQATFLKQWLGEAGVQQRKQEVQASA